MIRKTIRSIQHNWFTVQKTRQTCLGSLLASVLLITCSIWEVSADVENFQQLKVFGFNARWVQYSPDGRRIAAAIYPGVVRIIDAETFEQESVQLYSDARIETIRWSPNGQYIAAAHDRINDPAEISIWDVERGQLARTLKGHRLRVRSVAWSPDSRRLASVSYDYQVKIWDIQTGGLVRSFPGGNNAVAWSPDGKYLATGSVGDTVRVFEAETGNPVSELRGHPVGVDSVAWSPDSRYLASGGNLSDSMVIVWRADTWQALRTYTVGGGQWLEWSPGGRYLAAASGDIKIYDPIENGPFRRLSDEGHGGYVSVSWNPDASLIVSAGGYDLVEWDVKTGEPRRALCDVHLCRYGGSTDAVTWSPDSRYLATSGGGSYGEGTIKIWDIERFNSVRTIFDDTCYRVYHIDWSLNGRYIASANLCNTVQVWDAATGKELKRFPGAGPEVTWSPGGEYLASRRERAIMIWDVETEALVRRIDVDTWVSSIAWSPDGKYIASSGSLPDSTARIWEVGTWQLVRTLEGYPNWSISALTWSPDGRFLAGEQRGQIGVWEFETGRFIRAIFPIPADLMSLTWSPDGKYLASGSTSTPSGPSLRIWDAETGALLRTLFGHQFAIPSVKWSSDGKYLASCAEESTIRLWGEQPESP